MDRSLRNKRLQRRGVMLGKYFDMFVLSGKWGNYFGFYKVNMFASFDQHLHLHSPASILLFWNMVTPLTLIKTICNLYTNFFFIKRKLHLSLNILGGLCYSFCHVIFFVARLCFSKLGRL